MSRCAPPPSKARITTARPPAEMSGPTCTAEIALVSPAERELSCNPTAGSSTGRFFAGTLLIHEGTGVNVIGAVERRELPLPSR